MASGIRPTPFKLERLFEWVLLCNVVLAGCGRLLLDTPYRPGSARLLQKLSEFYLVMSKTYDESNPKQHPTNLS